MAAVAAFLAIVPSMEIPARDGSPGKHKGKEQGSLQDVTENRRGMESLRPGALARRQIDNAAYGKLLRQFGQAKALADGKRIHEELMETGGDRDTFLGNNLVQMYGQCGRVDEARLVFDRIIQRNVFSWTIMITAYAQNGYEGKALQLYQEMDFQGMEPNKVTFISLLTACSNLGDMAEGRAIHARIAAKGLDSDTVLATALLDMYSKCGSLDDAEGIFGSLQRKDTVSWTAMLAAYAQLGHPIEALLLFRKMDLEGVKPNQSTFVSIIAACTSIGATEEGDEIVQRSIACGYKSDVFVGSAVVNMYAKFGRLDDAKSAFERLSERNVVSWNTMVSAYAQHGHFAEALGLYKKMDAEGAKPDMYTYICLLGACSSLGAVAEGKEIHDRIGDEPGDAVGTAIVNMYAKCGSLEDAANAFRKISSTRVVVWNALIAGYVQADCGKDALELYQRMNLEGLQPDIYTYSSVLAACSTLRAVAEGKQLHARIRSCGLESVVALQNALVNMYARCGSLNEAMSLFQKMGSRDSISWNSMIAAYSQHGHGEQALELFKDMILEGADPRDMTFTSILHLCNHSGLLEDGHSYFLSMVGDYGIAPIDEHYRCMIDLLGRAGKLAAAEDLVEQAFPESVIAWTSLLAACRIHNDADRGARAAERLMKLQPESSGPLVQIWNLYAQAGRCDDVERLRQIMIERGLLKPETGYSSLNAEKKLGLLEVSL